LGEETLILPLLLERKGSKGGGFNFTGRGLISLGLYFPKKGTQF